MAATAKKTIWRIELWHSVLLAALLGTLGPARLVEPGAALLGGLFMGVNFLLLCYGVAWMLKPPVGKGSVRAGITLLVTKIILCLGLLTAIFFRSGFDAISFAFGFSTLLIAIMIEAIRNGFSVGA
jgi:hypothetical protein